jgi:quercetin dioxygenase-like cupin family protein
MDIHNGDIVLCEPGTEPWYITLKKTPGFGASER